MSWRATAFVKTLTHDSRGKKLTPAEKCILYTLADYFDEERQNAWPSLERLARESLLSTRQCSRLLAKLEQRSILKVIRNPNHANVYIFPRKYQEFRVDNMSTVDTQGESGRHPAPNRVDTAMSSEPSLEPPIEPPREGFVPYPDWIPKEPLENFVGMRKESKHPLTARAQKVLITELAKLRDSGEDLTDVLNQSILNNWRGVFRVHGRDQRLQPPRPQNNSESPMVTNERRKQEELARARREHPEQYDPELVRLDDN